MKLEILSSTNPAKGYNLYVDNKALSKPNGGMFPRDWDEDEVSKLIGETNFNKFLNGKYLFEVPAWKVNLIEGKRAASTREQLLFISQFQS